MNKSWPFLEAEKILHSLNGEIPSKGYVLFETGYGPSGLPHIGTFAEIVRTLMVKKAFNVLAPNIPSKIFVVSDDMDGMRKIPDNVPNIDYLKQFLGLPLSKVPDPFEKHDSFAAHMNSKLRDFLDRFDLEYEFQSSSLHYKKGTYDAFLIKILQNYQKVMDIMLPSLGDERRQNYSPFLPICPRTGQVLQVKIVEINEKNHSIAYNDPESHELISLPVIQGNCKLQWKPDWGMRWAAFDVDYEMHGKDLTPSAVLSSQITKLIHHKIPNLFVYELFTDHEGKKISKSKGNGLSVDDWLKYGPIESLKLFMYQNPERSKKLHLELIPKSTDDFLQFAKQYQDIDQKFAIDNPYFYLENAENHLIGNLNFALILNLVNVCGAKNTDLLWQFVKRYDVNLERSNFLENLLQYAINYYRDFVEPYKIFHQPTDEEKKMLLVLADELEKDLTLDEDALQKLVFTVGKMFFEKKELKNWFLFLYKTIFGQENGPKMGSFIKLIGVEEIIYKLRKIY